jgi:hypothetical protein
MLSGTPSAPSSPAFTHPPLVTMPAPMKREIPGPAVMPDVDGMGVGSDDGLGGKAGRGWLGDLDGYVRNRKPAIYLVLTCSGMPESMDENSKVSIKMDTHGTPAENLQRLITDCGVSPLKVCLHRSMLR